MQFFWQISLLLQIPKFRRKTVHSIFASWDLCSRWMKQGPKGRATFIKGSHVIYTKVIQTAYTCNFFGRFSNFYKFQNFGENLCTAIHHYYSTHVTLISIWSCIPHDEVSGQWCTIHLGPLWLQPTFIKGLTCTELHIHAIFSADFPTFTISKIS